MFKVWGDSIVMRDDISKWKNVSISKISTWKWIC